MILYNFTIFSYTITEVIILKETERIKNMPVGLLMEMGTNGEAMRFYSNLDETTQQSINQYIQNSVTGEDAKIRISTSVKALSENSLDFLNS